MTRAAAARGRGLWSVPQRDAQEQASGPTIGGLDAATLNQLMEMVRSEVSDAVGRSQQSTGGAAQDSTGGASSSSLPGV